MPIPPNDQAHDRPEHADERYDSKNPPFRLDAEIHVGSDVSIVQIILDSPDRKPDDKESLEQNDGHDCTAVPCETRPCDNIRRHCFQPRILIQEESSTAFSVKKNGTPETEPQYRILDPYQPRV